MNTAISRNARRVLVGNARGYSTVPAAGLYPHQWSWDSAFIAIGLRHLSPRRAQLELESLLGAQWADGRIPHIVFDPASSSDSYFPGPDFWHTGTRSPGSVLTSGLIQPPVHAIAVWDTYQSDPAEADRRRFLHRMYPRLLAWHHYLGVTRDLAGHGLAAIIHPWESGMDNSPSWDKPLERIEPVPAHRYRRRDLQHADSTERPTDLDYGRYVRLAADYRDSEYADDLAQRGFAVEDPLTNGLLAAAEHAMAEIAAEIGVDPAPHRHRAEKITSRMLARLYDPAAGTFFVRDLHSDSLLRHYTVAGLIPLVIPDLPVAAELVATATSARFRLGQVALVPSYDLTAADYSSTRYWRGPSWFNTSWLIWRGLSVHGYEEQARSLRQSMLDTVAASGFREYVDPLTAQGRGTDNFSWTAALTLDLTMTPARETAAC